MTAMGMSRLAFLASPPMAVTDSKPTRIRMATVACRKTQLTLCGLTTTEALVGMRQEVARGIRRGVADDEWHGLAGGIELGLRNLVGITHDGIGGDAVDDRGVVANS